MKLLLFGMLSALQVTRLAASDASLPPELIRFPSPDGKFALFIGWAEERHYDQASESGWVVDKKMEPAAIIDRASQKVVFAFDAPGRPDEDKALWSADSAMLAYSHRGNKQTELRVFSLRGGTPREIELPYLGEVEIDTKSKSDDHVHLDHDNEIPERWIGSDTLVVSHELSLTVTAKRTVTYTRKYIVTLKFAPDGTATIAKVTRQKQKATVEETT